MNKAIKEMLFTEEEISKKVKEMGSEITHDFMDKDLMVIGILKGSFIFMADLVRQINLSPLIVAILTWPASKSSPALVSSIFSWFLPIKSGQRLERMNTVIIIIKNGDSLNLLIFYKSPPLSWLYMGDFYSSPHNQVHSQL